MHQPQLHPTCVGVRDFCRPGGSSARMPNTQLKPGAGVVCLPTSSLTAEIHTRKRIFVSKKNGIQDMKKSRKNSAKVNTLPRQIEDGSIKKLQPRRRASLLPAQAPDPFAARPPCLVHCDQAV